MVENKNFGVVTGFLIPGKCLGTFCCHSDKIEPAYHDLLKRCSGTSENMEAIAAITDAAGVDDEAEVPVVVEAPAGDVVPVVVPVPVGSSDESAKPPEVDVNMQPPGVDVNMQERLCC